MTLVTVYVNCVCVKILVLHWNLLTVEHNSMQSFLKKLTWACLLIIPFLALYVASGHSLDLINLGTSGFYFPFITGKNLAFRLLVEIAFFAWIAIALKDPAYRLSWKKSPLLIASSAFMVVLFFADIFGIDPYRSFWSNFERMEGFFGLIHTYLYFVVLLAMLHNKEDYARMFKAFVLSNIAVLVFGYGQLLGASGYFFANHFPALAAKFAAAFPIHMSENRLDATLGNSEYFAVFCLQFIFLLALMWNDRKDAKRGRWYWVLIVLNLIALFYTGTRGTQLGLLGGTFITLVLIAWNEKGRMRKMVTGIIIVGALLVGSVFAFKNTSFIQSSPSLSRFASISPNDITGMSRLSIWKISYEAWLEHPILGYGQDNFSSIYASKFIPEKMWNLEAWYDRSHDVFFDWLIAGGALGLLSYLSLYAIALWLMWKKGADMSFRERAIITGLLAGYFVHNIFVFDNLMSYIFFFMLLGYIAMRTGSRGASHGGNPVKSEAYSMLYLPVVGIGFLVVFYYMIYQPVSVNHNLVKGLDINRLVQTMTVADAVKTQQSAFEKAIAAHTVGSEEAREQFYQTGVRLSQITIPSDVTAEDRTRTVQALNDFLTSARTDIANSYDAHQNDVRMLSIYGMFYLGTNDPVSAEKVLTQAHTLAPKKQLISLDLIRAYVAEGKTSQAYDLARQTLDLAPAYPEAQRMVVVAGIYAGKYAEAKSYLASKGITMGFDPDILSALLANKQISLAVAMLNDLKKTNPEYGPQVDAYIKEILAGQVK
jgi:O-antigen ligase